MTTHRRRSNRDRTFPAWIATAANAFGPEYELLISRAISLTGDLSHIKSVWLTSQAVPEGIDLMEAASHVRVVPRWVIVPRAMRDRMAKQIEDCGWRAAYSVLDGDDLVVISGWDWQHPKLPGSQVVPRSLVDDVCLLKGWKSRGDNSQHKRRMTLTLIKLNKIVIELGVWADGPHIPLLRSTDRPAFGLAPSPKNDMRDFGHAGLGTAWSVVGDHHDIVKPRRHEEYRCRQIAATLGFSVDLEQRPAGRIANLNQRHDAWLEKLTGKTIEVEEYTGDGHAVGDPAEQSAALDMTFEHVGYKIEDRRDRKNEFLEDTEKLLTKGKRKGKTYRPNKAGPCRRLTGQARAMALADMVDRPPKKGSQYWRALRGVRRGEAIGRGKERGLFEDCQRKQAIEVYTSDFKAEQELQDTQTFGLSANRSRRQDPFTPRVSPRPFREIDVPWHWGRDAQSYADELMTFTAKKPIPHEWGATLFGKRFVYGAKGLRGPAHVDRTPVG
jgi:hypothetical protein